MLSANTFSICFSCHKTGSGQICSQKCYKKIARQNTIKRHGGFLFLMRRGR